MSRSLLKLMVEADRKLTRACAILAPVEVTAPLHNADACLEIAIERLRSLLRNRPARATGSPPGRRPA